MGSSVKKQLANLAIFKRIPSSAQIISVYAVIMLVFYTWTILWFLWKYPSWLFFLTAGEILLELAYALSNCFFESLTVIIGLITLAIILPKKWFYDSFVARGIGLILPIFAYMIYIAYQFTGKLAYPQNALRWAPAVGILAIAIAFVAGKLDFLKKIFESVADRATIFIYLLIPVSIISLITVVIMLFYYGAV